jgi:hypothetical protein
MYYDLTKLEKKHARIVMDKGLEKEYREGLKLASEVLDQWHSDRLSMHEAYMKLIQGLEKINEGIGYRHNGKGGSRWVEVMASQLALDYISEEDLQPFREETKKVILILSGKRSMEEQALRVQPG